MLRLWVATVEYWRDIAIGPTVLAQAAESLRKIRNSARFMLGNMNDREVMSSVERVPKVDMGLVRNILLCLLSSITTHILFLSWMPGRALCDA